ncbi:hypothetical protein V494_00497 [Pseudogymnoascus sp. VKM F-4513 (FW-928)]|nr:hypothetical protein V494_00497 [Pseudogymnoascus sp. VKM F-4513 (FW-928)]
MKTFHIPVVQTDSAPDTDSEVAADVSSTRESRSANMERDLLRLFADIVCEQARQYLNSYPGLDVWGSNFQYHARFRRLARGEILREDRLGQDSEVLSYRLLMTKQATAAKDYLGLSIEDAHLFDLARWEMGLLKELYSYGVDKETIYWDRLPIILSMVSKANIFKPPVGNQGLYFYKLEQYLTAAFFDSGRSMVQIANDIERLLLRNSRDAYSTTLGLEIPENFSDIVAEQARQYLRSFPGNDASEWNQQHIWFRHIARGGTTDREHLRVLSNELLYRNSMTAVATRFKNALGISMANADLCNTWMWLDGRIWMRGQVYHEHWQRLLHIYHAIHEASVFRPPGPHEGLFFAKPAEYLAIALSSSSQSMEQILAGINWLKICPKRRGEGPKREDEKNMEVGCSSNRF